MRDLRELVIAVDMYEGNIDLLYIGDDLKEAYEAADLRRYDTDGECSLWVGYADEDKELAYAVLEML